jgi:hypothetical protein
MAVYAGQVEILIHNWDWFHNPICWPIPLLSTRTLNMNAGPQARIPVLSSGIHVYTKVQCNIHKVVNTTERTHSTLVIVLTTLQCAHQAPATDACQPAQRGAVVDRATFRVLKFK